MLYFISSGKTPSHSYRNWLALAVSTSLLTTLAWAGHAVAGIHNHVLHLAADILHLLLGSIWPGGLVPLGCFLWEANQENQPWVGGSQTGTLQRFSQFSLVTVFLLLITGFINGWLMIGSWIALFTSTYGQLLLVKVLVVFLMIGLGTYNRLCVLPHFEGDPGFLSKLRGTVPDRIFSCPNRGAYRRNHGNDRSAGLTVSSMLSSSSLRSFLWGGLAALGAVILVYLFTAELTPKSPLPHFSAVPAFSLIERSGKTVTNRDLEGKIWVADFIFTTCPGPCPILSANMARLQSKIAGDDRVQLVSFTVDPQDDTPAVLAAYADRFRG